ncbi:MAG: 3-deoxy-manno-octulosonate cytidylyltransferase [Parvularculaceae bacterium]
MKTLIVIPARYGSSRFPGKPLAKIAGRSMVTRVAARARAAADALGDARAVVATDDARIADDCAAAGFEAVITGADLPSGSDRALAAARELGVRPARIVNLQGDAPFTPVAYIERIVTALDESDADVATPVVRLDWPGLAALQEAKKTAPFSGTTAIVVDGRALWFSKRIVPAIRNREDRMRENGMSPVLRHVGLYAFRYEALEWFVDAERGCYERFEGLEQLRLLENGRSIACVEVDPSAVATGGIDTKEDLAHAEKLIAEHGDPDEAFFRG